MIVTAFGLDTKRFVYAVQRISGLSEMTRDLATYVHQVNGRGTNWQPFDRDRAGVE